MSERIKEQELQFVIRLGDLRQPLVTGDHFTIGKESNCDLRLGHGSVSPIHCRLQITESAVIVHDLNSLCGTKVDGRPVMDAPWTPGEILEIGEIRLELETQPIVAQAPPVPVAIPGAAGGVLTSHRHEPSVGEIMTAELKRAPWFALSMVLHAAVLLLLWSFSDRVVPMGSNGRMFAMEESEEPKTYDEEKIEEESVAEMETPDETFSETEVAAMEEELFFDESDLQDTDAGLADVDNLLTKVAGSGLDDILRVGKSALSGKFKKTVAGLRKDGLEIVFVFDSTGSMGTVLQAAKDRMEKMVSVMIELVPYARIGVITYRDSGPGEAYVTREVGLSRDFYRSVNFLQLVYAAGGGDEPEAVYEALRAAFKQKWSPTARRLVILIGDAPPHKREEGKIASMVKDFARDGRSFVHAIITRPSGNSEIAKSTQQTFRRIAQDGRGEALEFEDEGKILKAVMSLAFGKKERRSLDEVYRLAEGRNQRASSRSKRLAQEGGGAQVKRLRMEFSRPVVDHDLIKAILLAPRRDVLDELVNIVAEPSFSDAGKHAAAYILTRVLGLNEAPVDPESSSAVPRRRVKTLKRLVESKFK